MPEDKGIMTYERTLPENFSGVFHFTNWSNEDFVAKWGGKEYLYPAQTTSPMIIHEHSPLEIQNIRKKFAKDLAEREFYKSKEYSLMRGQEGMPGNRTMNSIHQAATYSMDDLTPFIQKALTALPVSQAVIRNQSKVELVEKLSKDEDGNINTAAVKKDKDLEDLAKGNAKASLDARVLA